MEAKAEVERKTKETAIRLSLKLNGTGQSEISTGIPFFDHMLVLFAVHGFFDLTVKADGDLDVDFHHTVEDVGLVLGEAFDQALGNRKGIKRFGHAVTPMDDALTADLHPHRLFTSDDDLARFGGRVEQVVINDFRADFLWAQDHNVLRTDKRNFVAELENCLVIKGDELFIAFDFEDRQGCQCFGMR